MSIKFYCSNPSGLLAAFKQAIVDKKITTWSCDSDGDFTHKSQQWAGKAWLRPAIGGTYLLLTTVPPETGIKSIVYGYYHGHFIETMLNHFDKQFQVAQASAMPSDGDRVS